KQKCAGPKCSANVHIDQTLLDVILQHLGCEIATNFKYLRQIEQVGIYGRKAFVLPDQSSATFAPPHPPLDPRLPPRLHSSNSAISLSHSSGGVSGGITRSADSSNSGSFRLGNMMTGAD